MARRGGEVACPIERLQAQRVVQLEAVRRHGGASAGIEYGGTRSRGERRGGGRALGGSVRRGENASACLCQGERKEI